MPEDASGDGSDNRDGRDAGSQPNAGLDTDRKADSESAGWETERGEDRHETRIPIDLSGSETDTDTDRESDDSDADADADGDEYTPEPSTAPIEAGDPDLEHALFVLLGAVAMVLVIARLLALPLG